MSKFDSFFFRPEITEENKLKLGADITELSEIEARDLFIVLAEYLRDKLGLDSLSEVIVASVDHYISAGIDKKFINDRIKEFIENRFLSYAYHPMTCGGGKGSVNCLRHKAYAARNLGQEVPFIDANEGVLLEYPDKFICPCGDYTQLKQNSDV